MTLDCSGRGAARCPHRRRAPPARPPRRKGGIPLTVVLAIVSIFWIAPLALLVITAVRPLSDFVANGPLSWPQEFTWTNFTEAWQIGNFSSSYRNSMILLLIKVPLGVLIAAMLAYALSKLKIRFARIIMFAVFLGLTIPIYITIVPNFITLRSLGLTDSLVGLAGPYLAFGLPFCVLVLQSFFRQVPDEIIEAAKIDGAGPWRIFFTIMLPLSTPALVTVRDPGRGGHLERTADGVDHPQLREQQDGPGRPAELPGPVREQQHRSGGRHLDRCGADPDRLHPVAEAGSSAA